MSGAIVIPPDTAEQVALVLQTLQDVVDEAGHDFVYRIPEGREFCMYVTPDGKPDCIAAHVLHRLGVSMDFLSRCEAMGVDQIIRLPLAPAALDVLRRAQYAQDSGRTWGEALEAARRYVELVLRG